MEYAFSDEWQEEAGLSIHAGFPNPAADSWLPTLDFNQLLVRHPSSTYTFRLRGTTDNASLRSGVIAVVDRAESYRDHDVVIWHDGQQFRLSRASRVAKGAVVWGVVTATIHAMRQ